MDDWLWSKLDSKLITKMPILVILTTAVALTILGIKGLTGRRSLRLEFVVLIGYLV